MDKELIENLRQAIETTAIGVVEDTIHAAGGTVEGRVRDGLITCNNADGEIVLEITFEDDLADFVLYTHTYEDNDPRWIADICRIDYRTGNKHWEYNVNCGEWR